MYYTSRSVYEYISRQTNDPIVQWKTCIVSGTEFPIYQSDLDFYDKISPTFAGQKFQIPTPTLCPEERQRRRLNFRNERKLYRRKCDATGENIISIYSPDKPYKVYDTKVWWSDIRDPMDYGFEFDFSTTFRENFKKLLLLVPKQSIHIRNSENSDYNNTIGDSKNCYMTFASGKNELCMYSKNLFDSTNSLDVLMGEKITSGYELTECSHCTNIFYSMNTVFCSSSWYLNNCVNCHNCYCCSNLINQSYCIFNKQYSKEEYELKITEIFSQKEKVQSTQNIFLNKITNSSNIFGSNVQNSNSSAFIFDCRNIENCKYITEDHICKDSYDQSYCDNTLGLECLGGTSYGSLFSIPVGSNYLLYSVNCLFCEYCFGCTGLRNKQYCIFNKQYTKEEYEIMVAKIITHMQSTGEWGEFFHPSLSPFGYNETVAQEYFPLSNDLVIARNEAIQGEIDYKKYGYSWSNYSSDPVIPAGVQTIEKKNHDDTQRKSLKETDDVLKQIFICEVSGRPYRIVKQELEFYRKHDLPIPSKHPDIRHEERMKLRPGRTLYLRTCNCCGKEMLSVYDNNHEGKVYCEECYQKEVFG